jgi:phosphoribosylamine--glycine ligase
MGAVTNLPFVTPELMRKVEEQIVKPTIAGMREEGIPYTGFLYCGLMLVGNEVFVIEYNCRMGDPETQVVFLKLKNDLLALIVSASNGELRSCAIEERTEYFVGVALCANGYPGPLTVDKGMEITLPMFDEKYNSVFFAGTKKEGKRFLTNGGRILLAVGSGNTMGEAQTRAYNLIKHISCPGTFYRNDIANDMLELEELKFQAGRV